MRVAEDATNAVHHFRKLERAWSCETVRRGGCSKFYNVFLSLDLCVCCSFRVLIIVDVLCLQNNSEKWVQGLYLLI